MIVQFENADHRTDPETYLEDTGLEYWWQYYEWEHNEYEHRDEFLLVEVDSLDELLNEAEYHRFVIQATGSMDYDCKWKVMVYDGYME